MIYLAVDRDIAVHNREKQYWLRQGISDIRVSSISEAVEKAITDQFVFIVINADNIDYISSLRILRDATNDPILVATTKFSLEEQTYALQNGADFYWELSNPERNITKYCWLLYSD